MRPFSALAVVVCLVAVPAARADEWVEFEDGRVMRVAEVARQADGTTLLRLPGGGAIAVPASSIVDRREIPAPPPPPETTEPAAVDPELEDGGWRFMAGDYAGLLAEAASRHGLEPSLLAAMARAESNLDPFAVSHKGACGLLQLMPDTAERFGVRDVFDARQNVDGGARYLRWLMDRYDGDTKLALAAYNAGEGAVDRHGGVPPFRETRTYVARVMEWAEQGTATYAAHRGSGAAAAGP